MRVQSVARALWMVDLVRVFLVIHGGWTSEDYAETQFTHSHLVVHFEANHSHLVVHFEANHSHLVVHFEANP